MKNLFNFKHFKGDLFGGITAGIVALPLALAFGVSSGLGPSAGLYGAIFVSFFAALFGGTNTQISGPTAPMTAVSMVVIAGILAVNDGDISKALPIIKLQHNCWNVSIANNFNRICIGRFNTNWSWINGVGEVYKIYSLPRGVWIYDSNWCHNISYSNTAFCGLLP